MKLLILIAAQPDNKNAIESTSKLCAIARTRTLYCRLEPESPGSADHHIDIGGARS